MSNNKILKVFHISNLDNQYFFYKNNESEKAHQGDLILTSLGKRKEVPAVVFEVLDLDQFQNSKDAFPVNKIKPIDTILYKSLISQKTINFIVKMSVYNIIDINSILEIFINNNVLKSLHNYKKLITNQNNQDNQDNQEKIKKSSQNVKLYKNKKTIQLNQEQEAVFLNIIKDVDFFNVSLIYGKTGSGKSFIFLKLIEHFLQKVDQSAQILILVPEITLVNNIYDKIIEYFVDKPKIWHSSQSNKNKKKDILEIILGETNIIISARSGLLLPYKNLKLIIIDEEHDQSYKQNEYPIYNARDMAVLYSQIHDIPIVLASATPSVETMYNALKTKYKLYTLNNQFFHNALPKIEIHSMSKITNQKNRNTQLKYLLPESIKLIEQTIQNKEQVLIFINRRGFTRTAKCNDCYSDFKCINCHNLLSFHKKKQILKCHYCNFHHKVNEQYFCQSCGSNNIIDYGSPGVEKIEQEVIDNVPKAKTIILSSDEINMKDGEQKISDIKSNEYNIIIGTQLATKGHHFPNLTTAIITDIDSQSNDGDYRSFERLFNLLVQIIGRAGREKRNAEIIIQTTYPNSPILQLIQKMDFEAFYKLETQERQNNKLPPFIRFVALIVNSNKEDIVKQDSIIIHGILKEELEKLSISNIQILGPIESFVFYLKTQYRYRFLLKMPKDIKYLEILNHINRTIKKKNNKINFKFDVDPIVFI